MFSVVIITANISKEWERYCFHRCLSVHSRWEGRGCLPWMVGGGTYLGWGRGYIPSMGRDYLPWMGEGIYPGWWERVPTLDGGCLPSMGIGYLPWMGEGYLTLMGGGVPTLDRRKGYLPWTGGGLGLGKGYLPQIGEGVPTLDAGKEYLRWGVPIRLDGGSSSPRRPRNRASNCYMVGGMPLAFMLENFLF